MSDDLVKRLREGDHFEKVMSAEQAADRIEELEAKLAQQDDLVQAAVAAALKEAAGINGWWLGITPAGEPDGAFCSVPPHDDLNAEKYVRATRILALIPQDAQAALDRVVAAERERCAKVADSAAKKMPAYGIREVDENGNVSWAPGSPWDRGWVEAGEAIAAAIREGKDE